MESPDLNPPEDPRLDALLRRAAPEIPDHGFTARVLSALPRPPDERQPWRRLGVCLVGAAAGGGFAFWWMLVRPNASVDAAAIAEALVDALSFLGDPLLGTALITAAFSLLYAFRLQFRGD